VDRGNISGGGAVRGDFAAGGLQTIPASLYEASSMTAATPWQQFWNVTLPRSRRSSRGDDLHVLFTFTDFQLIYVLTPRRAASTPPH